MARRIAVVAVAGLALPRGRPARRRGGTHRGDRRRDVGRRVSAVVGGKVGPGGEETSWYVEYGTTTAYGSRTGARSAGNGTAQVDVTEQLRGLTTGATYHYRVVATNDTGTARGADLTFTTQAAPAVVTSPASALGPTSATVAGTVDPNGSSTGWWVEYGTSTSYGSRTDTQSAGAGASPVGVSVRLSGLRAGVTYHFRVVAANAVGTTRGGDRSVPHRPCAGRLDRRRRRHHRLLGTPDGIGQPAGARHGVVVRVRHDDRARQPHRRPGRRVREPGVDRLGAGERPAARDEVLLPRRRAERRGHDGRADALVLDERRSARGHGCGTGLRRRRWC